MSRAIRALTGLEVLDSRGNPTLRVSAHLENGVCGVATVPAGASTGRHEAKELRDGEGGPRPRYRGLGVRSALAAVETEINDALAGFDVTRQAEIDERLVALDGTDDKSRLGANAVLGVSMAVAVAAAQAQKVPLYSYLGGPTARSLPVPLMNVINGGQHADNSLDFQEFMIVPHGAPSYSEALRSGAETYHALKSLLKEKGYSTALGDEGGFAPDLRNDEEACALIVKAIERAGFTPGRDIAIALDPAASSFCHAGEYTIGGTTGQSRTAGDITTLYGEWAERYPIVSIEDGLAEDDWAGFQDHTARLGDRMQIVGDDLYVTNTAFIRRGIRERSTNAVLIKPNQIGTVTETVAAVAMCRSAGWRFIISHRSGETDDTFIADFAVAMGGGQIKAGAPCRGERIAKYNRLLEIERELGPAARFHSPFCA